jgi:hypothetical protein
MCARFISILAIFVSFIVRVVMKHALLPWQERELRFNPREHRFEAREHRFDPREHRFEAQEHCFGLFALRFAPLSLTMVRDNPIF